MESMPSTTHCNMVAVAPWSLVRRNVNQINKELNMTNTIPLPPLPDPLIQHRATFATIIGYTADQLRARDLEVARVVLEAAAKVCEATYQEHKNGRFVTLPQFDGGADCADAIRALEFTHDSAALGDKTPTPPPSPSPRS